MSKRLIILIITLVTLIIGVGIWWWVAQPLASPAPAAIDPSQAFPVSPPVTGQTPLSPLAPATSPIPVSAPGVKILSERAVAGAIIIPAAATTEVDSVLFLERETGLIVEINLANRERKEIARLPAPAPIEDANLVLSSQELSIWFSTPAGVKKNYSSASLDLTQGLAATSTNFNLPELAAEPMNEAVRAVTLAPGRDRLFTLERVGEETIGKVFDLKTKKSRLVFNSRANQWLVQWPEKNVIALTNKPANQAIGYLYFLNLRNDGWQKILGGINGLTTLVSPNGQKILYGRSGNRGLELGLYDRLKNENVTLAISTLPEKCVWASDATIYCTAPRSLPRATYPDDWLAGEIIFDDLLWQINAGDGKSRLVWAGDPGLGDAINLLTTSNGKLVFTDRLTNRLFLVDELLSPPPVEQ